MTTSHMPLREPLNKHLHEPQQKAGHKPKISVIVPAYNVEQYVGATLDSLLSQTYTDFEVLVVDDASTDGTVDVIKACRDPRVILLRHAVNQGVAAARNTGVLQARGEFIALLDADDIALPARLAEQAAALDSDPTLGMVGAYVAVMNEAGRLTGSVWKRPLIPEQVAICMLFRNTVFTSMMMRRSAVPEDLFRAMPVAEDYDFNVRVARCSKVTNLGRPLTQYRVRGGGLTHTKRELMEQGIRDVMREQLRELGIEPTLRELKLNRHIGAQTLPNSPELLRQVEAWLMKLRAANANSKRYPEAAFTQILAAEWFEVCKFAAPLGLHALRVWRASALSRYWHPPHRELLKIALKCLLRHRRVGGDAHSLA